MFGQKYRENTSGKKFDIKLIYSRLGLQYPPKDYVEVLYAYHQYKTQFGRVPHQK
jgi:hypothetical protein